jgi:hypothetical protein
VSDRTAGPFLAGRRGCFYALLVWALLPGCSRETWTLDREVPLFRNRIACGFPADRNPRDAVQKRLSPGQEFSVRRREWVEGQACWGIRTAEGLDGWLVYSPGTAHRLR